MKQRTGSEKRLRKQELFRTIGYEPHGVQIELHRSRARIRVLACGARFGKSTCCAAEAVAALLEPRDRSLGWVVGPNLEVTNRIIEKVRLTLHRHFPKRIERDFEREHRIVVRNLGGGVSELKGKSADATASLLGEAIDFVIVDECASVKQTAWEEHLSARLIDRRGWAVLVGTPGKQDWFFRLFEKGQRQEDPDTRSWRAQSWTNPHVPRDLIEAERARLTPEQFDQQFGAVFLLEAPLQCATCGFPSATPPKWLMVDVEERLLYCRSCQNLVNRLGRTLIHRRQDGKLVAYALVHGVPGADDPDNE